MAAIRFPLGGGRYRYYGRARHVQVTASGVGSKATKKHHRTLYCVVLAMAALLYALVMALKD